MHFKFSPREREAQTILSCMLIFRCSIHTCGFKGELNLDCYQQVDVPKNETFFFSLFFIKKKVIKKLVLPFVGSKYTHGITKQQQQHICSCEVKAICNHRDEAQWNYISENSFRNTDCIPLRFLILSPYNFFFVFSRIRFAFISFLAHLFPLPSLLRFQTRMDKKVKLDGAEALVEIFTPCGFNGFI